MTEHIDAHPRKHVTVRFYRRSPEVTDVYVGGWRHGRYKTARGVQNAVARQGDKHNNILAREGVDRCWCGCKYWENDNCIDCGTDIVKARIEAAQN